MRSIIDLIMNSYTSSLYTKNYTHYTIDAYSFCYCKLFLNKKKAYLILQPLIWSVCLWCAFWRCFVRACVRFVWVSFSSFVCRSSWSFFFCSEVFDPSLCFRVEFRIRVPWSFVSNFEFEFLFRVCRRIFDSSFEFKFLEFSRRISNSSFSFRCSIRLLEFRCSIRFLEFQFSIRISIRVSNASSLIFRVEFAVEIFDVLLYSTSRSSSFRFEFRIRLFRFVALFDFSNFDALVDFSKFDFSIQVSWISNSSWSIRLLEFRFAISICESSFEFVVEIVVFVSYSSFEFFIELHNFRCSSIKKLNFCAKLSSDVLNYSRTSALASLSLPRELCARFSCVKY